MKTNYETRYASSPQGVKSYNTEQLRDEFLIDNLMKEDKIVLVYSHYDRFISGSAVPTKNPLKLETIDPLKADYFLERRELGIINIGEDGVVTVDGKDYILAHREALYVGQGNKDVTFTSKSAKAYIYFLQI